ncbi:putative mitochondrial-processing peptidase subunit beta, mitochondrial isoform X1 [Iris pallida]|uniref:Mitochondrial-processing peptidase subunit beta, mitochondrial isoform X1 n=1 Tax=Iris pallida TaxID=29817 RepID=A0AAX6DSG0_IRIPA|nr:putative mitochondrial-processing peptidase subunit beta, mitochondrial isoform X1 [Iris pallida]
MASQLSRLRQKLTTTLSSPIKARHLSLPAADPKPGPDPAHLSSLRAPPVRVTTLPNDIRVVTQAAPSSATHTASVGVWIDAGSRFELPGTNGTAHFLEHMIFKGTARRTARSLEEEVENMGGRLNAYTSREQTTFFADVQSRDLPAAVDILADILQNSRFPDHAIARERGVIEREMEFVQEQMEEVIFDHLHMAAFRDHPLGDTILGPLENIRSISKQDLQGYISTHYTGGRMVVSAAGAVEHDQIVDMINGTFKQFPRDPTTADQIVEANPATFTSSEVRVENDGMPLVHLAIAFKGASYVDPTSIPLMVMQTMLGSWNRSVGVGNCSGSQLAQRVSTDDLADSVMGFNTNYRDTGMWGVYATAAPDTVRDLSSVLMQEIRRLAYQVSEEELVRARNQLKSCLVLHIDGSTAVAENNGRQMLTYGRVVPFLELFARIDAVDAATIKETARNFIIDKARIISLSLSILCLQLQDVAIAAVGQLQGLPDLSWFRSQTRAGS